MEDCEQITSATIQITVVSTKKKKKHNLSMTCTPNVKLKGFEWPCPTAQLWKSQLYVSNFGRSASRSQLSKTSGLTHKGSYRLPRFKINLKPKKFGNECIKLNNFLMCN